MFCSKYGNINEDCNIFFKICENFIINSASAQQTQPIVKIIFYFSVYFNAYFYDYSVNLRSIISIFVCEHN